MKKVREIYIIEQEVSGSLRPSKVYVTDDGLYWDVWGWDGTGMGHFLEKVKDSDYKNNPELAEIAKTENLL